MQEPGSAPHSARAERMANGHDRNGPVKLTDPMLVGG